mmetsp:Transcript_27015/g.80106  ORF Transcript_27015/g.80106 Transcript_27015/m.80106 type:complete len:254 (+) Transcript_27015:1522-2283(+)
MSKPASQLLCGLLVRLSRSTFRCPARVCTVVALRRVVPCRSVAIWFRRALVRGAMQRVAHSIVAALQCVVRGMAAVRGAFRSADALRSAKAVRSANVVRSTDVVPCVDAVRSANAVHSADTLRSAEAFCGADAGCRVPPTTRLLVQLRRSRFASHTAAHFVSACICVSACVCIRAQILVSVAVCVCLPLQVPAFVAVRMQAFDHMRRLLLRPERRMVTQHGRRNNKDVVARGELLDEHQLVVARLRHAREADL